MFINITEVKFKNFMSYQEETVFKPQDGVFLISGKNGRGKSSILESIYYGLFGKPFRKISIGDLINNQTNKDMKVEISFSINQDNFTILRGLKPQKFEIHKNGEIILQDSKSLDYQKMLEENILKTNESVFKQLVLLGANIPTSKNFSELTNKEREELFKYIIDIGIFSEYSEISKSKIKELKNELAQSDSKLNQLSQLKIKLTQDIERQELQNKNSEETKDSKIQELRAEIEANNENLQKLNKALSILGESKVQEIQDIQQKIKTIQNNFNQARDRLSFCKQRLGMIEKLEQSHNSCLSCSELIKISGIDVSEKNSLEVQKSFNETQLAEFEKDISELNIRKSEIEAAEIKLNAVNQKINSIQSFIISNEEKIKIIQDVKPSLIDYSIIEDISSQEESLIDNKVQLETRIIDFITFSELIGEKNLKGKILEQSLPVINKWINYFLESFGNFPFLFTINSDLSESILNMDGADGVKSFNSLSNGQKLRIVFSILFAFLKYSEERNTTHFNVLFLDEVLDSSLDTEGRIELITILMKEFQNRSINIISHNQEIRESEEIFENIYEVKEGLNGSVITIIKGNNNV